MVRMLASVGAALLVSLNGAVAGPSPQGRAVSMELVARDIDGELFRLDEAVAAGPVVFVRWGEGCARCTLALSAATEQARTGLGVSVVVIDDDPAPMLSAARRALGSAGGAVVLPDPTGELRAALPALERGSVAVVSGSGRFEVVDGLAWLRTCLAELQAERAALAYH